jgi:hypothetical protein
LRAKVGNIEVVSKGIIEPQRRGGAENKLFLYDLKDIASAAVVNVEYIHARLKVCQGNCAGRSPG